MDDLTHVKQTILKLMAELKDEKDEVLSKIKTPLLGLFGSGVFSFQDSYDNFLKAIGQGNNAADLFDQWLRIQTSVYTSLGGDVKQLVQQFKDMFEIVMGGTQGGDGFVKHRDSDTFSYVCLLMIRVYGNQVMFEVEEVVSPRGGVRK